MKECKERKDGYYTKQESGQVLGGRAEYRETQHVGEDAVAHLLMKVNWQRSRRERMKEYRHGRGNVEAEHAGSALMTGVYASNDNLYNPSFSVIQLD